MGYYTGKFTSKSSKDKRKDNELPLLLVLYCRRFVVLICHSYGGTPGALLHRSGIGRVLVDIPIVR